MQHARLLRRHPDGDGKCFATLFTAAIVCDAASAAVSVPVIGDWHEFAGRRRYYGSSAFNGGERLVENRQRPMFLEFCRDNNSNR
jgi:hypothetical protein